MNSASLSGLAVWRATTITLHSLFPTWFLVPIDFLKILAQAGRFDNPIPTRFLAPIDCLKIPAQLLTFLVDNVDEQKSHRNADRPFCRLLFGTTRWKDPPLCKIIGLYYAKGRCLFLTL